MTPAELLLEVDRILADNPSALLTTIDDRGRPRVRWMVARRLRGRPAHLYAVTDRRSAKIAQLQRNPLSTWMVQTATISKVVTVTGPTVVIDSATLLQEYLDAAGQDLFMLWKIAEGERPDLVVLETVIEELHLFDVDNGHSESAKY